MQKSLCLLTAALLCCGLIPTFAQPGRMPGGPKFDEAMAKLFGDNSAFTATIESQIKLRSDEAITMPGKISYETGKARLEMNMAGAKGLKMPPGAAAQMKSMGLDQMISITLPEKRVIYLIYPGLQSYVETPLPAAMKGTNAAFKLETTEIGKQTVDGHPCIENRAVVTDDNGATNDFTVWNATDLKNFPVKIFRVEQGTEVTMSFKDIALTKPAASAFELPAGYTRYDNMQTMMQTEMMKKMGGGLGLPSGGLPPAR